MGDIREARTTFSSIMCLFREMICSECAMPVLSIKVQLNLIMQPCRLSFALPDTKQNVSKGTFTNRELLRNPQQLQKFRQAVLAHLVSSPHPRPRPRIRKRFKR